MKAILSLMAVLVSLVFCSAVINAQDMKKPDPVKSETFDMLMGKWVAEPYEMMGGKWTESATHYMKFGQYMVIDLTGSDDKGSTVNGMIIVKPGKDGNWTGWSFDDWGIEATYTGTAKGNKVTVTGKSDWGSDYREIEINGNTMVHKVSITMKGPDGKDFTSNCTITYHKQ